MYERPVPEPALDEVLVKMACVSVCGSDVHYYKDGRIGDFVVKGPLIPGNKVSGRIIRVGSVDSEARLGKRVSIKPQRLCRICRQCAASRYHLCPEMAFCATRLVDRAFQEYVTIQAPLAH